MAYYSSINKKIKDFFDKKNWDLQKGVKLDVQGDKAKWTLENKLVDDSKLESELKAVNDFDKETLTLTASSKNNPKIELKSKRCSDYFDFTSTLDFKENNYEIDGKKGLGKFNVDLKSNYNWVKKSCGCSLETTYVGIENLTLGVVGKADRDANNKYSYTYDIGLQYDKSRDQSFSLLTENTLSTIKGGAMLKFDKLTAYGQVIYKMKQDLQKQDLQNPDVKPQPEWSIGLQRTLTDVSSATLYLRHDFSLSWVYNLDFPKNRMNGQVAFNVQYPKMPTLGWRFTLSP